MTHEQETLLLEATLAVTKCVLQFARLRPEHRHFTERHRTMLEGAASNFEHASAILHDLARPENGGVT